MALGLARAGCAAAGCAGGDEGVHAERPLDHGGVAVPSRGDDHAGGRDGDLGRGTMGRLGVSSANRGEGGVGAAGAGSVGRERRHQDGLGPPDRVGGAVLTGARRPQVDRVAVEAHAHGRVGLQVVDRPRRRDHELVTVVADRLGRRGGVCDRRHARHEQHEQPNECGQRSGSVSEQSTHPHITRRAGPHPAGRLCSRTKRATWWGHANGVDPSCQAATVASQPPGSRVRGRQDVPATSGEGGIRTRDGVLSPYSLSRRVPSATRPPLLVRMAPV